MSRYHVERSIIIHASLQDIKNVLKDYRQWPKWSPWLIMEPDASLSYSFNQGVVGANYSWTGDLIGIGNMELTAIFPELLEMEVSFVKPFKSKGKVSFELLQCENGTVKLTWHMYGKLPFFMFWMKSKIKLYIGMDYERGLTMFKEYIEEGQVASHVMVEDIRTLPVFCYIGIPNECTIEQLPAKMKQDFEDLNAFIKAKSLFTHSMPFTIYHTVDIIKNRVSYVACMPTDENPLLPKGWISDTLQPQRVLKVVHLGSYKYLGNAWTTALKVVELKKLKLSKKTLGYEFYPNQPSIIEEQDILTDVCLLLR